jgi:hypothetical protein
MERLQKVSYRNFGMFVAAVLMVSGLTAPNALAGQVTGRAAGPANTWIPASQMNTVRAGATATLLPNGKVLVAGGGTATAELYDPATNSFTPTGKMPVTVAFATATLLPDGDVLVAGGEHGSNLRQVASAELYDPSTGAWTATGAMNTARSGQTATLLPDGDVLVAGGGCNAGHQCDAGSFLTNLASAELYDPSTGTWAKTGKMHIPREYATASLLPDGRVLETGGFVSCDDDFCSDTRTAELYDPATGTWAKTGSMRSPREQQTATLLPDGQVLVAGGLTEGGGSGFAHSYASAELYDPSTGTWHMTAQMSRAHAGGTATLLSNGWVLVAGGQTSVAEIYEPKLAMWVRPGAMSTVRTDQTATLLPDGHVLVTGGTDRYSDPQATAEVFLAGPGPLVSIAPGSIGLGGQQVGTTGAARTFTVSNLGSGNLVSNAVEVTGRNPSDFRVATTCSTMPVVPGGTCTVSVRFEPASTGLRTAVLKLSDNAPRDPQPVTVNGYGGGPNAWVPVGSLPAAAEHANAVLLQNGEVLIAGGIGLPGEPNASAELYNPATRTFTPTGSLNAARVNATAVLLNNGEVLIAGGQDASQNPQSSAELYSPSTGTWSNAAPMLAPGSGLTSTLLPNGNVLITGFFAGVPDNRGEVYAPSTNTWTSTGVMPSEQFEADAILLQDGKVLLAGGGTKAAELYDPGTNTWTATGSMVFAQQGPLATLLPGGEVEVAGGTVPHTATPVSSTELYDPTTGTWSKGFAMSSPRFGGTATLLPNGTILAAGGCGSCNLGDGPALSSTLQFTGQFWDVNTDMTQPRVFQTATLLPGGDVLVAGGGTCLDCAGTATAELYTPTLVSVSPSSGPVGTHVTITGNGFYAHEVVRLGWDTQNIGFPKTSADGTFSFQFTIPQATPGGHSISVRGRRSFASAFTGFTVTGNAG